ncbi:alpha/beta hydrolase [uncultured Tyzzerella sp.]|uniref:alpha/beta hydrolase n=1 Tax=uncultured Tyzzerella sp. TaxID=2321398 RepID=UPI0029420293|nr:alpha/beta hydrolase [uncultured Tyzzerella sp.]
MERINIWNKDIPLFDENIKNEENKFAGTIIPYLVEEDDDDIKKRGAMIILPGGGYGFCSDEGEKMARWFNFFGINAFVLDYRVAPYKHPAPIIDAKRAIRYVKYNAEKFNIDPNKVGVIGFSAGGHLAGCVAEFFDKFEQESNDEIDKICAKPDLAVLCYPVVSLCESYTHEGSAQNLVGEDKELRKMLSLEKNVREDMPEMFLWHTVEDASVNVINTLELGVALKNKNVPYSLHIFNKGAHGSVLAENIEETKQWSDCLKTLLKNRGFIDKQSYRWL